MRKACDHRWKDDFERSGSRSSAHAGSERIGAQVSPDFNLDGEHEIDMIMNDTMQYFVLQLGVT